MIYVETMQGVAAAIASGGHGGHGGYGHSSHGIGTACIVKVGADRTFLLWIYFDFFNKPFSKTSMQAVIYSAKSRLLCLITFFAGLLLPVPLLQVRKGPCPLQGLRPQGRRLR